MSLIWHAGFEAGDLSEVGYLERASSTTGWGTPDPTNIIAVVSPTRKFNGQYVASCRMMVAHADGTWSCAKTVQYEGITSLSEVYFGVALYIPSATFDITLDSGYVNLMSINEVGGTYRGFGALFAVREAAGLLCQIRNDFNGYAELSSPMPLPLDRWFTVVFYYRGGVNGNVKCWIDDVQVADWSADLSGSASVGPEIDAGINGSGTPAGIEVLVDEMKAASTYDLALPVPSVTPPPQHMLSITTVPTGISFTIQKLG